MAKRPKRLIVVRFRESRGMWEVDYRDRHGKRHRPLFATEADALSEAAKRREDLEKTVALVNDPDLTLDQYTERWLQTAAHELEAKTRGSYAQLLKSHVLPMLGSVRLRDLHRRHVKMLLGAKRAERLPRERKPKARRSTARRADDTGEGRVLEEHGATNQGRALHGTERRPR